MEGEEKLSHPRVGEHSVLGLHISMATISNCYHKDRSSETLYGDIIAVHFLGDVTLMWSDVTLVYYMTDVGAPCVSEYVGYGEGDIILSLL